ncbi:MAG: helix-turn-helix domain-containing protein [Pseudomonadota bacterium]
MTGNVFSVDAEPAARRLDVWRDAISDTFVSLDCEAPDEAPMRGTIASAGGEALLMSHVDTIAQTVARTPRLIRRDHAEVMLISVQLSGRGGIAQDGREAALKAGDFAIYDATRPYSLHFHDPFDQLVLHMPRERLRARLGPLAGLTARRFGGGASAMAARGFLSGLAPALRDMGADAADRFGTVALDLIAMAVAETREEAPKSRPGAAALHRRATAEIAARAADPTFSTPALAVALGLSTRRLQEAFAAEGDAPMAAIWRRRLEMAEARLADPSWANASILEIGLASGFADAAQFSRRYRAAYGLSPRDARRTALT